MPLCFPFNAPRLIQYILNIIFPRLLTFPLARVYQQIHTLAICGDQTYCCQPNVLILTMYLQYQVFTAFTALRMFPPEGGVDGFRFVQESASSLLNNASSVIITLKIPTFDTIDWLN